MVEDRTGATPGRTAMTDDALRDHLDRAVERSLTVTGRGRGGSKDGRLAEETQRAYARGFAEFDTWCRSTGRTAMPCTSETLVVYARALLDQGKATATVRKIVAGIKARHRTAGVAVPDDVPVWYVLRAAEPTPSLHTMVKLPERVTMVAAANTCDPDRAGGVRDLCLITLVWDLVARPVDLVALNIADVDAGDDPEAGPITIRIGGRDLIVNHDHDPPTACPVHATLAWLRRLRDVGITAGALFRPVDQHGTIGGTPGTRRAGITSPTEDRLLTRSLRKIWDRHVARAGVPRFTPQALRYGAARDRVDRGDPLSDVLRRGGWSPGSAVTARLTEPPDDEGGDPP